MRGRLCGGRHIRVQRTHNRQLRLTNVPIWGNVTNKSRTVPNLETTAGPSRSGKIRHKLRRRSIETSENLHKETIKLQA